MRTKISGSVLLLALALGSAAAAEGGREFGIYVGSFNVGKTPSTALNTTVPVNGTSRPLHGARLAIALERDDRRRPTAVGPRLNVDNRLHGD